LKLNANATTAATAATADTIHILANKHGAPLLPAHMHGSISHKDHLALGVGGFSSSSRVGCDIERVQGESKNSMRLMSRIITPVERAQMGHFQVPIEEETLLYFSLKESIFKAIHPFLARQVDFDEVLVKPSLDGTVEVSFQLRSSEVSDVEGSRGNNRSPQNSSDAVRLQPSDIGLGRDYESFLDLVCTARWALYDESGGDRSYWLTFAEVHDASGLGDPNASNSL
jgi:4'-phosphopantetheinyl transferase EntD